MIEWLIGFLVAYWWIYKRKPKGQEQNLEKDEPVEGIGYNEVPFGYLKNDETVRGLI